MTSPQAATKRPKERPTSEQTGGEETPDQQSKPLLPRLHLFEIEDQPWFPTFLRDYATDYLYLVQNWLGLPRLLAPKLRETLEATGEDRIVDLCSGGSGPITGLAEELRASAIEVTVLLTDKFPNLPAFERLRSQSPTGVEYVTEPVDAADVPSDLEGVRTLFNAFHHFRPEGASKVLENAVRARRAIAVFEVSERSLLSLLRMLAVPIMVLLVTPAIRPFRWGRLFWTYPAPVVPLVCLWDGLVSQLRSYSGAELLALAQQSCDGSYRWEQGGIPLPAGVVTYLIGVPRSNCKGDLDARDQDHR